MTQSYLNRYTSVTKRTTGDTAVQVLSELKTTLVMNFFIECVSIKASVCPQLHMKLVEDRFDVWMSELKFPSR